MTSDPVKAPAHYTAYAPMEPLDVCRHLDFCLGNVLKYACRAPFKGGAMDIDKGNRYLDIAERTNQGELDYNLSRRQKLGELLSKFSGQVLNQHNLPEEYRRKLGVFLDLLNCHIMLNRLAPILRERLLDLKTALPAPAAAPEHLELIEHK